MPTLSGAITNQAANSVSAEQIDGQYQTLPYKALVQVGLGTTSAVHDVNATFAAGGIAFMQDDVVPGGLVAGQLPVIPDHFIISEVLPAGTRLSLTFRNTGAVATYENTWVVKITPA